ncbi:MAG TPA: ABC transporter ATP-binding protein [Acidimicrobiales bacterium]|nr:ABC transporter ATP-binding protein [Acidimicrobiales bacterium]
MEEILHGRALGQLDRSSVGQDLHDADGTAVYLRQARRLFGDAVALSSLDLAVERGTVTVLLGPNGAGKTTALRVITGALPVQSGEVRVFGVDPAGPDGESVRLRCGVVAAKPSLYDRLSGRDNLRYAAELWGLGAGAPIEESAARFGIVDALDLRVGGYSTGMKTRLALARAVLHDPELLLLDEPTSGLDPESSQAVLHLIDELAASGKTVVMCTHLLLEAEGLADQVVMMEEGAAVVAGAPADLVRRYWPTPSVVIEAEDPREVARAGRVPGVLSVDGNGSGPVTVSVDDLARVPDVVNALVADGVRITRVVPVEPTLEQLYLKVRAGGVVTG